MYFLCNFMEDKIVMRAHLFGYFIYIYIYIWNKNGDGDGQHYT
jgi:hypothetical protein